MKNLILLALSTLLIIFVSCKKNEISDPVESLNSTLEKELNPLAANPLEWTDDELRFLDKFSSKKIVGLGEATHGTAEFFDAKHRIFRYLVENHGYKVFAFEADFGESVFLNAAIQNGNCDQIKEIMTSKMHFWTWMTTEVQELLEWMCSYNTSLAEGDKLQYVGVDCAFNTFHPELLISYLTASNVPFLESAMQVLGEAESGTDESFESYDADSFDSYIKRLEQLDSTFVANKDYLIGQSSLEEYEWNKQVLTVVRQASDVRRTIQQNNFVNDPRDPRMADNAIWYSNYFNGDKIAVWAHNGHIDNNEPSETMGYYLKQQLGNDYGTVGFSFSKGSFTAIGQGGLRPRTIVVDPEENSLNQYFSQSEHPQFSINLNALEKYQVWRDKFSEGIEYIYIGSVFNRTPDFYYSDFEPEYFDEMIYIDNTTAADNF